MEQQILPLYPRFVCLMLLQHLRCRQGCRLLGGVWILETYGSQVLAAWTEGIIYVLDNVAGSWRGIASEVKVVMDESCWRLRLGFCWYLACSTWLRLGEERRMLLVILVS